MTKPPAPHGRGRHAKPPSEFSVRWNRMLGGPGRRRLIVVGTGTASVALIASAAVAGVSAIGGPSERPRSAVAVQASKPSAKHSAAALETQAKVDADDPDAVPDAVPYLQRKDTGRKVAGHVKDVRRSGDFLRVYTDLEEGDENSEPAVSLCEWTTQFLKDAGDSAPRVFIHGKSEGNGEVVLANKQSDDDDCEVGETR
ncbi:hypothetical protein [Spirillospora sp. CA-294931]|uniref:hypothetical protein n=1 Tax=Spirillospora sp. CA-294931 TaxID=3240042 RepID=UPI003D922307